MSEKQVNPHCSKSTDLSKTKKSIKFNIKHVNERETAIKKVNNFLM